MKKINDFINKNFINILTIFLLIQPIIDLITGIQVNSSSFFLSIGVVLRFIFLIFIIYYTVFISTSRYKKYSIYYFLILFLFLCFFLISNTYIKGIILIPGEIKWLIKNYYFPILLVGFINFYDCNKERIKINTFIEIILSYVLLIIACKLIGVESNAYSQGKTGYIGLFHSANEISGILSLLLPYFFFNKSSGSKLILKIIMLFIIIYCTLMIGSKTAFLSLFIIVLIFLINFIYKLIKKRAYKYLKVLSAIIISGIIICILVMPYTAFYKNIKKHVTFLNINSFSEVFENGNINRLIFSDRLTFLEQTRDLYTSSNSIQKVFGIGFSFEKERKTIEIDYFDVFYCYGPVGFIIYFMPLFICLIVITKRLKMREENIPYIISIFLAMILGLFTGHIFLAPSVSIYISLIVAYAFNDAVQRKKLL